MEITEQQYTRLRRYIKLLQQELDLIKSEVIPTSRTYNPITDEELTTLVNQAGVEVPLNKRLDVLWTYNEYFSIYKKKIPSYDVTAEVLGLTRKQVRDIVKEEYANRKK